jgi:hypothetical protein
MDVSDDLLERNPDLQVDVGYVGRGKYKAVVVDHFYKHPEKVLQLATELSYTDRFELVGNFPGVRTQVNLETCHLIGAISELWGAPLYPFFKPQPVVFQAITTKNYRLNIGQRAPHVDPDVTAMVYLNPERSCFGGTGLYRHRLTGLERLPRLPIPLDHEMRHLANRLELSDEFFQTEEGYENFQRSMIFNPLFAARGNNYINEGNDFWELLQLVEMRPNRLVIFDARVFHSQHLEQGRYDEVFRVNQILYLTPEQHTTRTGASLG